LNNTGRRGIWPILGPATRGNQDILASLFRVCAACLVCSWILLDSQAQAHTELDMDVTRSWVLAVHELAAGATLQLSMDFSFDFMSPRPLDCAQASVYCNFSTVWQKVACYDTIVSLFLRRLLLLGHNVSYKVMEPFIHCCVCLEINNGQMKSLNGYFTSGKMNLYFKWVIYIEEMWNYFWIWSFLDWETLENVFLAYVDERQQLLEWTCFTALGGHAYW